jgi:hypothetical protein
MNKKDILKKIQNDLDNAELLFKLMDDGDVKMRLGAQSGYIRGLLEWINQEGKV